MASQTILREARLRSGLTLDEVIERTRLSPPTARALDEGRFDRLPAGLYARAYVRAFATAVGADAREIEDDLRPWLPTVDDPIESMRALVGTARPHEGAPGATTMVCAAALLDGLLLAAVNGVLILVIAAACRVPAAHLLTGHGPAVAAIAVVATLAYFLLFAGIDGRTPGRALCGLPRVHAPAPLRPRHIVRRAARIGLEEASLVLTLADFPPRRSGG